MPASSPRPKRRLLGVLLLLQTLPALQTLLNVKVFRLPLVGYEVALPRPRPSLAAALAGTYQDSVARYATQRLGFRPWLMRPRNQLAYALFGEVLVPEIVAGRQGQLFERGPVLAYLGRDPAVPEAEVRSRVRQLRAVQDTLARRGKLLVIAIAPSKPALYPDLLPDSCRRPTPPPSNYGRYAAAMRAAGLNLLDLPPVFRAWRPTSPHPLFPPGGTHWSGYGVVRAADTLLSFITQRGHLRLPAVRRTGLEISTTPRYTDDDLLRVLNLLWNPQPVPLAYPVLAFDAPRPGEARPRLLLVADSFGYSLLEFYPYLQNVFAPGSQFWYYNQELAWPRRGGALDIQAQLAASEVVVLLINQANMGGFDFNFGAQALQVLQAPRP